MSIIADFIGGSGTSTDVFKTSYITTTDEMSMLLADRANMTNGAAEPFVDSGDVALTNATISGGYVANTTSWTTGSAWNIIGAISSTTATEAGYPASNVNSGVTNACWLSGTPSIIFTYANAFVLRKYAIGGGGNSYPATSWYLYGSNDATNWAYLDYRAGQETKNTLLAYEIENTVAYRYYKILGQNPSSYFQLFAVYLYTSIQTIVNPATITINPVSISGATSGRIVFRGYNVDTPASTLDVGNSGSNKIEVYPMLSGSAGSALSFTSESLGNNIYRYTSEEFSLSSATSFGVRFQSFARSVAPNFIITNCYWIWR